VLRIMRLGAEDGLITLDHRVKFTCYLWGAFSAIEKHQ
jgi:hypothetical protein